MDGIAVNLPAGFKSARPINFPCMNVVLVNAEKVVSNEYNPNKVATPEMSGLANSIDLCGVTQPIVVYHDKELDCYFVVDGFHRYIILKYVFQCPLVPVVVLDKGIAQRIASTVRHNKAKGEHKVELMGELVNLLEKQGLNNLDIAKQLGMEEEEILRLKQTIKSL